MQAIDLNSDIGEAASPEGQAAEREILKLVSSANIACGGHAGNDETMRLTVRCARENGVVIGAHPGYPDPQNFGRKSIDIADPSIASMIYLSLTEQIIRLSEICADAGTKVSYVKPHGALYNDAVNSREHADLIARTIAQIDTALLFMGAPNSEMKLSAMRQGLTFVSEGFIDRRYTDDGHLQNRSIEGAVIKDQDTRMAQARSLVETQSVLTATGNRLSIEAHSLCLHGDTAGAVETARLARKTIELAGVEIRAFVQ